MRPTSPVVTLIETRSRVIPGFYPACALSDAGSQWIEVTQGREYAEMCPSYPNSGWVTGSAGGMKCFPEWWLRGRSSLRILPFGNRTAPLKDGRGTILSSPRRRFHDQQPCSAWAFPERDYIVLRRGGEYYERHSRTAAAQGELNVLEKRIEFVNGSRTLADISAEASARLPFVRLGHRHPDCAQAAGECGGRAQGAITIQK